MSRRRAHVKHIPITISLLPSMVAQVEEKLTHKESRSAWIAKAIAKELAGETEYNLFRDGSAMHMFNAFKAKMEREGVQVDIMFYEMIKKNIESANSN